MNQQAIDNAVELTSDLWSIQNLFYHDELKEFLSKIANETSWIKVELQEENNRQHIPWETDGVCDWLFSKLADLDFSRFKVKLRTVMIWKDSEGYTISPHKDNERVVAALQIYLSPDYPGLGTWFLDSIEIPFIQNTGYFMHNKNRPSHGMKIAVPQGYTRLSFYALFDDV